eukprot:TRINITY_DN12590_c0_g1_i18.p1 TRINITY_DN12590_c0_g1~~TRINITY_DN12590_c0_g1_i18.p1  ORF type:complete len:199 (+),score=3.81 TRINITY_DN12590_c0_g1_i18:84-680(+)
MTEFHKEMSVTKSPRKSSVNGEIDNPIEDLLYGAGVYKKETSVKFGQSERAVTRSSYRKLYIARHNKASSVIRAPAENENIYAKNNMQVYRRVTSVATEKVRLKEADQGDEHLNKNLNALEVAVVIHPLNKAKFKVFESKTVSSQEESKSTQRANSFKIATRGFKENIRTIADTTNDFIIDLIGPRISGTELKPLIFK